MAQDLQTLILINCGATEDVARLLDLREDSIRVIVIDSHRPFHHNLNDPGNKNILAFCNPADGTCDNVPEPDIWSGELFGSMHRIPTSIVRSGTHHDE